MVAINLVSQRTGARVVHALACVWLAGTGCGNPRRVQQTQPPKQPTSSPSAAPALTETSTAPPANAPAPPETTACATLTCTTYPAPDAALQAVLAGGALVIGFGEAHAPSDFTGRTTVQRFSEELLPSVAPKAKRLLVELLAPPSGCEKPRQDVQAESDAITEGQSEQNQNDYVALGHAARRLGVVPDILRPTCEDMQAIAAAEVRVLAIMETIARLSLATTERWITEPARERTLVLLYGGALHNDVAPRDHLETWSYGPGLVERTGDRYVEVDLVVPELVQHTESWQKFLWYDAVRSLPKDHDFVLVQVSERSFALVFPRFAQ